MNEGTEVTDGSNFGDGKRQYSIRFSHDGCWMTDVTRSFPGAYVIEKTLYHGDEDIKTDIVPFIDGDSNTKLSEIINGIQGHPDVNYVSVLDGFGQRARLMVRYTDDHSVNNTIANADIMPIKPVHAVNGVEHWSVLMNPADVGTTLKQIEDECDAEIQSICGFDSGKDMVFTDLVDQTNDDLSPRQIQSLLVANNKGYYDWPRHATASEIAEELDIPGPTCLEYPRKGEQRIVRSIIDTLQRRHGHS